MEIPKALATSAGRNALYASGLVAVNHLISAIHAARIAGRLNSQEPSVASTAGATGTWGRGELRPSRVQLAVIVLPDGTGIGVQARRRF